MHYLKEKEVLDTLETSKKGLKDEEASSRLKKYGLNQLEEIKRVNPFKIFFMN